MDSIVILYFLLMIIFIWIIIEIKDKRNKNREFTELQNTPIEVYRYTYRVYLNDGSNYLRLANGFCIVDFKEFVEHVVLKGEPLEIANTLVINIASITKAELVSKETKIIKPKVNKCYNSFYLSKGYSVKEVLEREIK